MFAGVMEALRRRLKTSDVDTVCDANITHIQYAHSTVNYAQQGHVCRSHVKPCAARQNIDIRSINSSYALYTVPVYVCIQYCILYAYALPLQAPTATHFSQGDMFAGVMKASRRLKTYIKHINIYVKHI